MLTVFALAVSLPVLCGIETCSLTINMLSIFLLSNVFPIGGCLAGSDVAVMVYMLTQGVGWALRGRTGCVRFATHRKM
jgi:hypothetical protein